MPSTTLVKALPTRCFGRARPHADRLMSIAPAERGLLAGLPVPIKDLTPVAGVRTTFGARLMQDFVSERSDVIVETVECPHHLARFTCRVRWSPGQLVLWDNRFTLHYPVNDFDREPRLLYRRVAV